MPRMNYEKRRRKQIVDERGALPHWWRRWKPSIYPERKIELPPRDLVEPLTEAEEPAIDPETLDLLRRTLEPFLRRLTALSESDRDDFIDLLGELDRDSQVRLLRFLLAFAADE